jgi:hypothetical protein
LNRTIAILIIFFALISSPASSKRVKGSGSFNGAPIVSQGRYADTIRHNEFLFYAVELAPGERLDARAIIKSGPTTPSFSGEVRLLIHNPWRIGEIKDSSLLFAPGRITRLRVHTPFVGSGAKNNFFVDGGLYYIAVGILPRAKKLRYEHQLTLDIRIKGSPSGTADVLPQPTPTVYGTPGPIVTPTPSPIPTPSETITASASPQPTAAPVPLEGKSSPSFVRLGLIGFLGGAVGGAGLGLLRRRSS